MNARQILHAHYLDILFENRDKDYGAYELRKHNERRMGMALGGTAIFIVIISLTGILANTTKIQKSGFVIPGPKTSLPPAARFAKPALPLAKPDKPPRPVTKEMPPLIVNEIPKEIDPVELMPGESISEIAISGNGAGSEKFSLPVEIAASNVIVQPVMKKDAADKPFIKVEIEARFPGGEQAWYQYISKALLRKIDASPRQILELATSGLS